MTLQQDQEQKFTQLVQGAPHAPITEPSGPIDPTDPADLQQDQPDRARPPKRSRRGLVIGGIAAGTAGVLLAGGLALGLNSGEKPADPNEGGPVAEGPANPGEEAPTAPEMITVEQLEIPAGLETEQVGQLIIDRFDDWRNAGTNDVNVYTEWQDLPLDASTGDFVTAKAEEYGTIYADALYIDGWQNNHEDLIDNYKFGLKVNANTLEINLKTSYYDGISLDMQNSEDLEGFQRHISFEDAREISSEGTPGEDGYTRVVEINYTESNNADRNRAGEAFAPETASFGNPQGRFTLTLVTAGGVEKIAATSVTTR